MEFSSKDSEYFEKLAILSTEPLSIQEFTDDIHARSYVNWCLSGSYDDEGIERWWQRPRQKLDGNTPEEYWPINPEKVIGLAGWLVNRSLEQVN